MFSTVLTYEDPSLAPEVDLAVRLLRQRLLPLCGVWNTQAAPVEAHRHTPGKTYGTAVYVILVRRSSDPEREDAFRREQRSAGAHRQPLVSIRPDRLVSAVYLHVLDPAPGIPWSAPVGPIRGVLAEGYTHQGGHLHVNPALPIPESWPQDAYATPAWFWPDRGFQQLPILHGLPSVETYPLRVPAELLPEVATQAPGRSSSAHLEGQEAPTEASPTRGHAVAGATAIVLAAVDTPTELLPLYPPGPGGSSY